MSARSVAVVAARPLSRLRRLSVRPAVMLSLLAWMAVVSPFAAAEDQKVWRALTDGDRSGRTAPAAPPPAVPAAGAGSAGPVSRVETIAILAAAGIVALGFTGLAAARRLRRTSAAPGAKGGETEAKPQAVHTFESLWRSHMRRKPRQKGPAV